MQALLISRELKSRGHDVGLLCTPRSAILRESNAAGVPAFGLLGDDKKAFGTIKDLSRFLKSYDFDVVHTHLSHDLWWLVPALKLSSSNAKLFLTKHMASGVKKTDPLHRFLYGRLQATFAISNYIRGSVLNTCPVSEKSVHVLAPGISLEIFNPSLYDKAEIRNELGVPPEALLVGMTGRITPGKGHREFLLAAKKLSETSGLNLFFVVIGGASYGEESFEMELRELVDELGLTNVMQFTGFRNDVPRLLSAFDILAFPSHEESFGLALVEAMAMRVPVVASASAGVLDIVIDRQTGILFPPKNHDALADAITTLVLDPDARARYAASGRERVEKNFSIRALIQKLEKYYTA